MLTIAHPRPRRNSSLCWALIVVLLGLGKWLTSGAEAPRRLETEAALKAAYLIKFTQDTEWPPNAFSSNSAPLEIGVLGSPGVYRELLQQAKEPMCHPVQPRQVKTLQEALSCNVVFVGDSAYLSEAHWFSVLSSKAILTVGDSNYTLKNGGDIRFIIQTNTVHFEVNLDASQQKQLRLDPNMLSVATKVYREKSPN